LPYLASFVSLEAQKKLWKRKLRYISVVAAFFLISALPVFAEILPGPEALAERIGHPPSAVTVYEPHLATTGGSARRTYLGWRFSDVASTLFGANWQNQGDTVEFRALDGYVSRVAVSDFTAHSAWLASGLRDGGEFTVDNLLQNETGIPLGPYYLVWENIEDREIFERGASIWPYRVAEILTITLSTTALLPDGLDPTVVGGAEIARVHCLNCHMLNGFGGNKVEGDLAALTAAFDADGFRAWVLYPNMRKPDTTMPAIAPSLPEDERAALAEQLWAYLAAMPREP
jgi:mono/diheme cytochrome c family protein